MTIQYCMSNARHVLQVALHFVVPSCLHTENGSLMYVSCTFTSHRPLLPLLQSVEVPAVTNVRASHDYHPNIDQWSTGVSGMFHHAVGLAPSKDNFWTTDKQKGTSYDKGTATEPYNRLQAAATISTTGPVATSDKIGRADRNLIMSMCTSDGMLLQPDKPATIMDAALLYRVRDATGRGAARACFSFSFALLSSDEHKSPRPRTVPSFLPSRRPSTAPLVEPMASFFPPTLTLAASATAMSLRPK